MPVWWYHTRTAARATRWVAGRATTGASGPGSAELPGKEGGLKSVCVRIQCLWSIVAPGSILKAIKSLLKISRVLICGYPFRVGSFHAEFLILRAAGGASKSNHINFRVGVCRCVDFAISQDSHFKALRNHFASFLAGAQSDLEAWRDHFGLDDIVFKYILKPSEIILTVFPFLVAINEFRAFAGRSLRWLARDLGFDSGCIRTNESGAVQEHVLVSIFLVNGVSAPEYYFMHHQSSPEWQGICAEWIKELENDPVFCPDDPKTEYKKLYELGGLTPDQQKNLKEACDSYLAPRDSEPEGMPNPGVSHREVLATLMQRFTHALARLTSPGHDKRPGGRRAGTGSDIGGDPKTFLRRIFAFPLTR
ncbi:hypothetical protein B0H11DRAFT_1925801 [Mycena galericulata]|nr:hypothetical protein B0H11DRAFT_1925801 [Mycena galericulata]